jgi:uncharacterized protein
LLKNRFSRFLFGFIVGLSFAASVHSQTAIPPAPERWVTDRADFLSSETRDELDARLESFERSSGRQLIVYIEKTTGGMPIEEWAVKAFKSWRVGRKGIDDGLILFIMASDRTVRLEVGYGLEGIVPDAVASRVIRDILIPNLKSGERDRAVREAISSLLGTISGEPQDKEPQSGQAGSRKPQASIFELILIGAAVLFFLALLITHPSLALWLLFSLLRGGGGGFGRGSARGGGFFGGGGRSGGGGASGSW